MDAPLPPAPPAPTVLVVEDDEITRVGLTFLLRAAGRRVIAAADGRQALDYLERYPPPDLILLDLLMPVLDGWNFLGAVKDAPRLAAVPVVVMTAASRTRDWALASGCAGFLQKPFSAEELLAEVRRCLA
jgi:CheY-like chemotaxis protein